MAAEAIKEAGEMKLPENAMNIVIKKVLSTREYLIIKEFLKKTVN